MPIIVFMLLSMLAFGSSASAQKSSSNCQCSLSCAGAEAELKKHESVEVHVEYQSDVIYNKILTVSSLFDEKGRCSVVVKTCLQGDKQYQLRIYFKNTKQPLVMDLKPECDTETLLEDRDKLTDGEHKTHSVTEPPAGAQNSDGVKVAVGVVAVVVVLLAGGGGFIWWKKCRQQNMI